MPGIEFDEALPRSRSSRARRALGQKTFAADSAISIKPISIAKSRRIVEYAFEYAAAAAVKR